MLIILLQWSVTQHERLYAVSGNHAYDGEEAKEAEEIDVNKVSATLYSRLADANHEIDVSPLRTTAFASIT